MTVPTVPLGEIALKLQDGPFGSNLKSAHYVSTGVRVVRLQNIGKGRFDNRDQTFISPGHFQRLKKHECRPGDILIATLGDPVLRAAVQPATVPVALNKADCIQLRCDPSRVSTQYVSHYLNSGQALAHGLALSHGQTRTRINLTQLRHLPIPMPPVKEQWRIAAILDAADELRAKRRQALAKVDTLAQAIFIDMFGDPASNPKAWDDSLSLAAVADIRSGITKGRRVKSSEELTSVPYLAVVNVQDGHLCLGSLKRIDATRAEIERYRLERGDIVLTEGGDPDKLGRGTVWSGGINPCIYQNHIFRIRIADERYEPEFISRLLGSQRGKRYFLRMAKQTTGIASINMTQLRRFPLLSPPVEVQRDYLCQLRQVDAVRTRVARGVDEVDTLFASLQQRAFRGEL